MLYIALGLYMQCDTCYSYGSNIDLSWFKCMQNRITIGFAIYIPYVFIMYSYWANQLYIYCEFLEIILLVGRFCNLPMGQIDGSWFDQQSW